MMGKKTSPIFQFFVVAVMIFSSLNLSAQCFYSLQLFDSFGDGWNGAELTVNINGVATPYTLDFLTNDGEFVFIDFVVSPGDEIILDFSSGTFDGEITYNLLDADDNILFTDGTSPMVGDSVFIATPASVVCNFCEPPVDTIIFSDIKANFTDFEFFTAGNGPTIIEYGLAGFVPGTGTVINTASVEEANVVNVFFPETGTLVSTARTEQVTLVNLIENTDYEIYLSVDCGMDTSAVVGPYPFKTIWLNDVGIVGLLQPNAMTCGSPDSIEIIIQNFGQLPQSLIPMQFSINGVPANVNVPVDGLFTGVISFDSTATFIFDMNEDFSEPGTSYTIQAWTEFEPDLNMQNDTFTIDVQGLNAFPLIEDFEVINQVPEDWVVDTDVVFDTAHLSITSVMYDNLWTVDREMLAATANYAFVSAGDELTFDYRIVDFGTGDVGTIMGANTFEVEVTQDCGETYSQLLLIDSLNHVVSTAFANITIDLTPLAGESVGFRFRTTWAEGDYYMDIDNVNVIACPANLGLATNGTNIIAGNNDGTASVTPSLGVPPYIYDWNNGGSSSTITGLGEGVYTVMVTDSLGCVDQAEVVIGLEVATYEIETLQSVNIFPNPTFGQATLQVGFNESSDVTIQILDVYGKIISEEFYGGILEKNISLEADRFEAGMYFIRIETGGNWHLEKLLKL